MGSRTSRKEKTRMECFFDHEEKRIGWWRFQARNLSTDILSAQSSGNGRFPAEKVEIPRFLWFPENLNKWSKINPFASIEVPIQKDKDWNPAGTTDIPLATQLSDWKDQKSRISWLATTKEIP